MKASYLCYTRTTNEDYRWIFIDSKLSSEDILNIAEDYKKLKQYYIDSSKYYNLAVRKIQRGFAIYTFFKTDRLNRDGNIIFQMSGFLVLDEQYRKAQNILSLILSHCFFLMPKIPVFQDEDAKIEKDFDFPINDLFNYPDNTRSLSLKKRKLRAKIDEYLSHNELVNGIFISKSRGNILIEPLELKICAESSAQKTNEQKLTRWEKFKRWLNT